MKRLGLGFLTALALSAGCYSPDLSGVRYTCDETNAYCPDGLECISGACLPPGGTAMTDGGMESPPDGTVATAGCKSGQGYVVGTAFACPGAFNSNGNDAIPNASGLCAAGFKLCTDAKGIDQNACKQLSGFFGAQVNVRKQGSMWQCANSGTEPYFAGCGKNTRGTVADLPAGQMCGSFAQAINCSQDQPWYCTDPNLDRISNSSAADGVLCCPM